MHTPFLKSLRNKLSEWWSYGDDAQNDHLYPRLDDVLISGFDRVKQVLDGEEIPDEHIDEMNLMELKALEKMVNDKYREGQF